MNELKYRFDVAKIYEGKHMFGEKHVTDRNREDAVSFLQKRPKDKPFSLQVAFYAPKAIGDSLEPGAQWTPMERSRDWYANMTFRHPQNMNESYARLPEFFREGRGTEGRRRWKARFETPTQFQVAMNHYYRMISEVDEACGLIYEELKKQGILNETMIIFTTDNGFFHAEHGLSGKWFPYQESIRVPLIIRDPRMPPERINTTNDEFTLNVDLAETILGAAGLGPDPVMQGRDISDLYLKSDREREPWRQEFYYEFPGKNKKILPSSNAVVRHDFKYFHYPQWNVEHLFNIKDDPFEENDLISDPKYADIVKEMKARYAEMQKEVL